MLVTDKKSLEGMVQVACYRTYCDEESKAEKVKQIESEGMVAVDGGDHLQGWKSPKK